MKNQIKISVPKPCHENWANMTPDERGRFCASCQKTVYDFTKTSDREIVKLLEGRTGICGRFLNSQLERKLHAPNSKNRIRIAVGIATANVLGLFSQEAFAKKHPQRQNIITVRSLTPRHDYGEQIVGHRIVNGRVGDALDSLSLEGVKIVNKNTMAATITDSIGNFAIKAAYGDSIEIQTNDYRPQNIIFKGDNLTTVLLQKDYPISFIYTFSGTIGAVKIQRRTFFGRIFHSIGNLFR